MGLHFSFEDLMRYHGPRSPGGVAHAYKVLERALPLLAADGLPERREIEVLTAFEGPGARDGFECVLRAVSEGHYRVDHTLARPDRGPANERFVFVLSHRDREVTLTVRDGFVTEEFVELARTQERTSEQEGRLIGRLAGHGARASGDRDVGSGHIHARTNHVALGNRIAQGNVIQGVIRANVAHSGKAGEQHGAGIWH